MDELIADGRSLSFVILLPATAIFTVMLAWVLSRTPSRVAQFVIFAIWFRWIMSAFHTYTFTSSPLGLSWNALGAVVICGLGLLVIRARRIFDVALIPFYVVIGVVLLSGALNHAALGMIDTTIHYVYLAVLILATVDAVDDIGIDRFVRLAIWPYAIPFGLQILSVLLHSAKASESDGSVSYIGGYQHEAAFSMILASGLFLVCMGRRFGLVVKGMMILVCCAGIVLANYRTAVLAMGPLVAVTFVMGATRRFVPSQRSFVTGVMAICAVVALLGGILAEGSRFADLGVAMHQGSALIKPPESFDRADRSLLSGRPLIWSNYIYAYEASKPIQHLVGLGPNSWQGVFYLYAHNTLVSALYELGVFGVVAILFLWGWMVYLAACIRDGSRWVLLGGHASFIVLNMATMPMWNMEGLILYALLCGFTVAGYQAGRREKAWPLAVDQDTNWAVEAREIA